MFDRTKNIYSEQMKKLDTIIADKKNHTCDQIKPPVHQQGFWHNFSLLGVAILGTLMINVAFDVVAENRAYQKIETIFQSSHTHESGASINASYDFKKPLPDLVFDRYTVVPDSAATKDEYILQKETDLMKSI